MGSFWTLSQGVHAEFGDYLFVFTKHKQRTSHKQYTMVETMFLLSTICLNVKQMGSILCQTCLPATAAQTRTPH